MNDKTTTKIIQWKYEIDQFNNDVAELEEIAANLEYENKEKCIEKSNDISQQFETIERLKKNILDDLTKESPSKMQKQLLNLFAAKPDYAGFDMIAAESLLSGTLQEEHVNAMLHMQDILVEHLKLVSEKAVEVLKK